MKVVFTVARRIVEKKQLVSVLTEEIVVENVAAFLFDEGTEKIKIAKNDQTSEILDLHHGDDDHMEQWFFADIKCFQVPLKVKL